MTPKASSKTRTQKHTTGRAAAGTRATRAGRPRHGSETTSGDDAGQAPERAGRRRTPLESAKDANVLASGKVASSPSSPSSTAVETSRLGSQSKASGCLRAAPGGSGRALALRCARRPRASAGEGRTDASGGGSKLRMAPRDSTPVTKTADASASPVTERSRTPHPDSTKVVNLSPQAAKSQGAPTRSEAHECQGAQERLTMSHIEASSFVEQVLHHDAPVAPSDPKPSGLKGPLVIVQAAQADADRPIDPKRCVGIDLGKRLSLCEVRDGQVVGRQSMMMPAMLETVLGPATEPARVAIEACREAWFYHERLTQWGHKVLIVDTTRARSLGIGHRKRKNDRIDAEVLARAVESGRIPLAHVLSPECQEMRAEVSIRRALVETRTTYVVTARGLMRVWGVDMPSCDAEHFVTNVDKLVRAKRLSKDQYAKLQPLLATLNAIEPQIKTLDTKLETMLAEVDIGTLLTTCPGVGTIVACAFVSVIDTPGRFRTAHQVEAYLGLVPSENTSGKRKLGSITKAGNPYLRALLVQAAWNVFRARGNNPLKQWAMAITNRKGKRVAVVAIARRLAGILWAMWRDGTAYDANLIGKASSRGLREQACQVNTTARAVEASC